MAACHASRFATRHPEQRPKTEHDAAGNRILKLGATHYGQKILWKEEQPEFETGISLSILRPMSPD
jgi:hypothetical protein